MGFENEKIRFGFLLSGPKMVVNGIETSDDPSVREKFFRKWREREKKNRNGIGKFEFFNLNLQKKQKRDDWIASLENVQATANQKTQSDTCNNKNNNNRRTIHARLDVMRDEGKSR